MTRGRLWVVLAGYERQFFRACLTHASSTIFTKESREPRKRWRGWRLLYLDKKAEKENLSVGWIVSFDYGFVFFPIISSMTIKLSI